MHEASNDRVSPQAVVDLEVRMSEGSKRHGAWWRGRKRRCEASEREAPGPAKPAADTTCTRSEGCLHTEPQGCAHARKHNNSNTTQHHSISRAAPASVWKARELRSPRARTRLQHGTQERKDVPRLDARDEGRVAEGGENLLLGKKHTTTGDTPTIKRGPQRFGAFRVPKSWSHSSGDK